MMDLASFQNVHSAESVVVCGCGQSLNELQHPERFITIGVNDVGRKFQPDYLVVVNPRKQFAGDRFRYVENSQAKFIFTQLDLGLAKQNVVRFSLGKQGGVDFSNPNVLHYTQNSPYVALCLAIHMGARRIGLIGVDFTNHHFFASTGVHSLTASLASIDEQYRRLGAAVRARGVAIYNLSAQSRLSAFPKMTIEEFGAGAGAGAGADSRSRITTPAPVLPAPAPVLPAPVLPAPAPVLPAPAPGSPRVFVVNYNFLTCGDVFGIGLSNAAKQLGLQHEVAFWNDPNLPARIDKFRPDLIFVVHGRRFADKWKGRFSSYKSAVWLVDEPYEVDDTARWSKTFGTVFINDPNTLSRHPNAHYLPVCFDPVRHRDLGSTRSQAVGFVGGFNETRNQYLERMASAGMLSYVVGGPWKSNAVQRLSIGPKISPEKTTALYQDTSVVLNVFRDVHHFNHGRVPARSMNPRIYEALACGALVISEERDEIKEVFPDLPTFTDSTSLIKTLKGLISNEEFRGSLLQKSRVRLEGHSYADRLTTVLKICLGWTEPSAVAPGQSHPKAPLVEHRPGATALGTDWIHAGDAATLNADGLIELSKPHNDAPGSETGLAGTRPYTNVELSFDLFLHDNTHFIAKVHQGDQLNQKTNSYHFVATATTAYAARHNHIFKRVAIDRGTWHSIVLRRTKQQFEVRVNGATVVNESDKHLERGYCFLGVKGGRAKLRKVRLTELVVKAPGNGLRKPGALLLPFTSMPKRNLLYHVWPVRGTVWKWNLEQLLKRIELFNGRRVMSIVTDQRSEAPEAVQRMLAGHGFEFVVARNDQRGEAINFAQMLRMIASRDENEITFYGHAKGVKYEPDVPEPIRRWAEVQYQVVLDDWLTVREQLQRYAMTGTFKRYGRFNPHRNLADWHYSGTYFWVRHAHLFARDYQKIPQFYGGVETWPGTVFRKEETGCVFIDNLSTGRAQLPYYPEFWATAEPALKRWQTTVRTPAPPKDLVEPRSFKPEELEWLLDQLCKAEVKRLLVIGSKDNGFERHLAHECFTNNRSIEITIIKSESDAGVAETLAPNYDAVFLDGDRSYKGCRAAFNFALTLQPRLIALHNIVDSDWQIYAPCCVSRVWNELKSQYQTIEKSSGDWGGMGLVVR